MLYVLQVTHTSDSFDICQKYARQMIKAGQAYMDDTDQEKMQVLNVLHPTSIACGVSEGITMMKNVILHLWKCGYATMRKDIIS